MTKSPAASASNSDAASIHSGVVLAIQIEAGDLFRNPSPDGTRSEVRNDTRADP
jgi:hypothetical protein